MSRLRLAVNVDHVATLRNARGGANPDPIAAAQLAARAGADGIVAHLREDRRHMRDADIAALQREVPLPLDLEMAATEEMTGIALRVRPAACCLVPERRAELTTESGLDIVRLHNHLAATAGRLQDGGIKTILFADPDPAQIAAAAETGARAVELHTGAYCEAAAAGDEVAARKELARLQEAARQAAEAGLAVHAGHGLDFDSIDGIAAIPQIEEVSIGHFLVGAALFEGLEAVIRRLRRRLDAAGEAA